MNIQNTIKLINFIHNSALDFDMNQYWAYKEDEQGNTCGTAACIAGHAAALTHPEFYKPFFEGTNPYDEEELRRLNGLDESILGKNFLELSEVEAEHVFYGDWSDKHLMEITKEEALDFLAFCIEIEKEGKESILSFQKNDYLSHPLCKTGMYRKYLSEEGN